MPKSDTLPNIKVCTSFGDKSVTYLHALVDFRNHTEESSTPVDTVSEPNLVNNQSQLNF